MNAPFYIPKQCRDETQPRIIFALDRGFIFVRTILNDYKQIAAKIPNLPESLPIEPIADDIASKLISGAKRCDNYCYPDGRQQRHRHQWTGEQLERIKPIPFEEVRE